MLKSAVQYCKFQEKHISIKFKFINFSEDLCFYHFGKKRQNVMILYNDCFDSCPCYLIQIEVKFMLNKVDFKKVLFDYLKYKQIAYVIRL